jgi:hypothetical protein
MRIPSHQGGGWALFNFLTDISNNLRLNVGWSMKFRETKFRERIPFVFREILQNFAKFREIFATKFRFLLDNAKNNVAVTEQETSTSFLSPFAT